MPKARTNDWTQFVLRIAIRATPAQVFKAWTHDKTVSKWFTEKTMIEPRRNGRICFEWLDGDKLEAQVISITKNQSFTFPFGRRGERVTVKFKKDGKGCVCELRQYNMTTSEKSKWEMHRGCMQGWTFFLTNLKAYLEHGIDLRDHNPKQSYRQDFVNS
jgi:uncharacterized protein YndB with AHSA1/START domain